MKLELVIPDAEFQPAIDAVAHRGGYVDLDKDADNDALKLQFATARIMQWIASERGEVSLKTVKQAAEDAEMERRVTNPLAAAIRDIQDAVAKAIDDKKPKPEASPVEEKV